MKDYSKVFSNVVASRSRKGIARYLRESRLPLEKNLAIFDWFRLPPKIIGRVNALLEGSFLKRWYKILPVNITHYQSETFTETLIFRYIDI